MPVSFSPATIKAEAYSSALPDHTPTSILQNACKNQFNKSAEILQSSFPASCQSIVPLSNGFIHAISTAYNRHHALVIRPDDVWLAILSQFNFFVNGNSEVLRSQFVTHEGKKELVVTAIGNRYTVDFGSMAKTMTGEIEKNVVDPALRAWIMPNFTTTTQNDTIVSAMVMMATLKNYFSYKFNCACGLPRVTLEGEKRDWQEILDRLEKLKEYGLQTIAWYHLLVPVISRLVKAFDDPDSEENIDFWGRVLHYEGGGSGPSWLAGWITAFSAFNDEGKWLGTPFVQVRANFTLSYFIVLNG